jgi:outer membrane biogenesis lipoprotein LolB
MKVRQRVALLFAAVVLAVLAGCTQPTEPGGQGNQPAPSQGGGGIPGY